MSYWKPGTEKPVNKVSVLPITQNDSAATAGGRRGNNSSGSNNDNKSSESSLLKSKLSKSVLGMKFMKTKVEVSTNQDLNAIKASLDWKKKQKEDDQKSTDVSSSSTHSHEINLSCKTDDFNFNAVLPGRRSFNGCNKAMERHYQMQLEQLKFQTSIESNITIASNNMDEEMIKKYEKLVGLPRGPSGGMMPDNDSKKRKLNQPDHRKKR